jgi:deazaflavin-dependent oxidoreductase (nitroreductase family)
LDGDRIFALASKGGSDENPHWYGNLVAHPEVTVELGTETFPATAKVLTGPNTMRSTRSRLPSNLSSASTNARRRG